MLVLTTYFYLTYDCGARGSGGHSRFRPSSPSCGGAVACTRDGDAGNSQKMGWLYAGGFVPKIRVCGVVRRRDCARSDGSGAPSSLVVIAELV